MTVKTHVKAILRKIGVKNRTQAALWAIANLEAVTPNTGHEERLPNTAPPPDQSTLVY